MRWILIEDAPQAIAGAKRFARKDETVLPRQGKNKAKTAVAALMLRCIHAMLSRGGNAVHFRNREKNFRAKAQSGKG